MYKYNKTTWKNKEQDPKGGTPLSAANFNNMEEGIEQAHIKADRIETTGIGKKFLSDDGTYKFVSVGSGDSLTTASDDYVCFTATEDISTFTIQTTSDSTVTLLKENLEMVKDVDYTINKDTGVVSLNFILKKDEKIYYKVEEHISVSDMATVSDLYKHAESSEPHKNVIGTDTLTTSAKTVKEAINEVNNETINKIIISDSKPENMVKNTFYLENKPMADSENLLYKNMNTYSNKLQNTEVDLYSLSEFTIGFRFDNNKAISGNFICGQGNNVSGFNITQKNIVTYENTKEPKLTPISLNTHENIMIISLKNGEMKFILNGVLVYSLSFLSLIKYQGYSFAFGGYSAYGGDSFDIYFKDCFIYNRALSQEEVKYNFHSLGEDKVATIEDADGREYAFSAKSQNVFMTNGSNLDSAMNQFISWKELQMNSDGTFSIVKCADWYSDKIYIEGQTVKNIIVQTDVRAEENRLIIYNLFGNRIPSNGYSIKNTTSKRIIVSLSDINTGKWVKEIPLVSKEIKNLTDDLYISSITGLFSNGWTTTDADKTELINTFFAVETDKIDSVSKSIPFGLNSLGHAKGIKTYISLESNGYENQIEIAEPLKKVGDVADTIDGNVLTRKIKEITKDDILDLKLNNVNYLNVGNFYLTIQPCLTSYGICNILDRQTTLISDTSTSGFLLADSKTLFIRLKDITTVEEAKKWLYDNNFQLQYQLATPTVEQIKSTFVYAPNQNGECSFKFNNAVAPSNSKLSVAQTTNQALDEIKTAIISLGGAL